MSPRMNHARPAAPRRGFSLIELMVVIVIISILIGLLLAALGSGRTTARIAAVNTDIKALETGITQFNGEFSMDPPSKIVLYENAAGWTNDTQNRTLIQRIWPQFNFAQDRDINKNGTPAEDDPDGDDTDGITLTGDECLLFFLGGIDTINTDTTAVVARGFSQNPADPFASGGNRIGPFGEFDPDRMVDNDGDGAHAYLDGFYPATESPYLYLSSYGGQGYRILDGDINQNSTVDDPDDDVAELNAVYLQADGTSPVPWKENSYQIISAGFDGTYGIGGLWSSDDGFSGNPGDTSKDRDNVTSFSGGTLE